MAFEDKEGETDRLERRNTRSAWTANKGEIITQT